MKDILITIIIAIIAIFVINFTADGYVEKVEKAYFEGQKDYMENDIRIKLNSDSILVWKKSPWNDNRKPLYQPNNLKKK